VNRNDCLRDEGRTTSGFVKFAIRQGEILGLIGFQSRMSPGMRKLSGKRMTLENPIKNGRGGEIRTHDLLYPKQARYQATLRPEPRARENAQSRS
jgi:hypothetical protein